MKTRCYNTRRPTYRYYGGRGIKVCDRWLGKDGFKNFLTDMGTKPSQEHELDRYPNSDGHYEPGNCRWATHEQQAHSWRGEKNPHAKITEEQVLDMHRLRSQGWTYRMIAARHQITKDHVALIIRGVIWKHVMKKWRAQNA